MRFSEAWLREWVNPAIDSATLADQLTMAGLEVDSVEPAAPLFQESFFPQPRKYAGTQVPASFWQVAEQPSPATVFPSSQVSPDSGSSTPSPQAGGTQVDRQRSGATSLFRGPSSQSSVAE